MQSWPGSRERSRQDLPVTSTLLLAHVRLSIYCPSLPSPARCPQRQQFWSAFHDYHALVVFASPSRGEMMSAFHDAVQGRDDERISAMSDFDARISPSQGRVTDVTICNRYRGRRVFKNPVIIRQLTLQRWHAPCWKRRWKRCGKGARGGVRGLGLLPRGHGRQLRLRPLDYLLYSNTIVGEIVRPPFCHERLGSGHLPFFE